MYIPTKLADALYRALKEYGEDKYENGVTACFWNIVPMVRLHLKDPEEDMTCG